MTYTELNYLVKEAALSITNVNTYTEGDIYNNWHKTTKYSAVNMGLENAQRNENTITYNVVLYYGDRPTRDDANRISIYDDGVRVLQTIIDRLPDEIGYALPVIYTPFEQEFEDVLDGVYARISFEVPYELGACGLE